MATHTWDPAQYLDYADERSRPFVELLARVGADDPADVLDVGCGPGHLTGLLASRWPGARVRGLDSSPAMVAAARERVPDAVEVSLGDARDLADPGSLDVLVTNATLQWVPGHLDLLDRLVAQVRPGGWLALQVPGNLDEPSHALRRGLAQEEPWAPHLRDVATPASHDPQVYWARLTALGCEVDAWETTYQHVLTGPDPVLRWVAGTGARPTLQALPDDLRPGFEAELGRRLAAAYPTRSGPDGEPVVLLGFRRVFAVARVGDRR